MNYFILVTFVLTYIVSCQPKGIPKKPNVFNKDFNVGGEVDEQNNIGDILLIAKEGDLKKLKELVNQGQDIHKENKNGQTAFHVAAGNGHLDVVQFLLDQGVSVDKKDKNGYTALHWASLNGHVNVVQELLNRNANLSFQNNITEGTALHLAAFGGHLKVVQVLIAKIKERGASEHLIVNKLGETPYGMAVHRLESTESEKSRYQAIVNEFETSFPEEDMTNTSETEPS